MTTDTKDITVRDIVAEACENQPDPEKAIRAVLNRLAKNRTEQVAWNKETVTAAVSSMVHDRRGKQRVMTVNASWLDGATPELLEAPVLRSMLDMYTVGSKRLGDCDAADLTAATEQAEAQRKGVVVKIAFFRAVVKRIGEKRVREVFNDRTIVELHRQAEGSVK